MPLPFAFGHVLVVAHGSLSVSLWFDLFRVFVYSRLCCHCIVPKNYYINNYIYKAHIKPVCSYVVHGIANERVLQFDVQILSTKLASHWKYMIQKPKADLSAMVIAPMPGMVKSVTAEVGDQVGNRVFILSTLFAIMKHCMFQANSPDIF